jgi:hypothetical protein
MKVGQVVGCGHAILLVTAVHEFEGEHDNLLSVRAFLTL